MTPEQRAVGRTLLDGYENAPHFTSEQGHAATELLQFMLQHFRSLLADHEEIAREAVREFAEAMKAEFMEFAGMCERNWHAPNQQGYLAAAKLTIELAAARGVKLDEKR